jgi:hypothetical protein
VFLFVKFFVFFDLFGQFLYLFLIVRAFMIDQLDLALLLLYFRFKGMNSLVELMIEFLKPLDLFFQRRNSRRVFDLGLFDNFKLVSELIDELKLLVKLSLELFLLPA